MHGVHGVTQVASAAAQFAPQPRLVKAAHEFEAQMMKELLRPMTSAAGLFGEDGPDGADGEDTGSMSALDGFASEALGQALSAQGGFGIADKIIGELSQHGNDPNVQKMTKKPQRNGSLGVAE
jgi:Rod binding domain-containing protein